MSVGESTIDVEKNRRNLAYEAIPNLRKLLKRQDLMAEADRGRALLALIQPESIGRWGVLMSKVLVTLARWRVLFTVQGGLVEIEFFPTSMIVFPSEQCPQDKRGLYFCFALPVGDLVRIHGILMDTRELQVDFAALYHGLVVVEERKSEAGQV